MNNLDFGIWGLTVLTLDELNVSRCANCGFTLPEESEMCPLCDAEIPEAAA